LLKARRKIRQVTLRIWREPTKFYIRIGGDASGHSMTLLIGAYLPCANSGTQPKSLLNNKAKPPALGQPALGQVLQSCIWGVALAGGYINGSRRPTKTKTTRSRAAGRTGATSLCEQRGQAFDRPRPTDIYV